jgi:hypothetical protein
MIESVREHGEAERSPSPVLTGGFPTLVAGASLRDSDLRIGLPGIAIELGYIPPARFYRRHGFR